MLRFLKNTLRLTLWTILVAIVSMILGILAGVFGTEDVLTKNNPEFEVNIMDNNKNDGRMWSITKRPKNK